MAIQEYVIKNFMTALYKTDRQGAAALDEAISAASKGKFSSTRQVIDKLKKDIRRADNPQKFLKVYCGIDLDKPSAETGARQNISQKNFTDDCFSAENSNLQIQLCAINAENAISGELSFSNLTDAQKIVWQNLRDWVERAISLVKATYGDKFGFEGSSLDTPKTIYFGFYDQENLALADTSFWSEKGGKTIKALMLKINMHFFGDLDPKNFRGAEYIDITLAHEFTHCAMAANINYFGYLPQFIKEGMAEYTCHGEITALKDGNILRLADKSALLKNGAEKSLLDTALDLTDTGTGKDISYSGGYMFICYFARQVEIIFTVQIPKESAPILRTVLYAMLPIIDLTPYIGVGSAVTLHHARDDSITRKIPIGVKFTSFHERLEAA